MIQPALSEDRWEYVLNLKFLSVAHRVAMACGVAAFDDQELTRHGLAAMALLEQPFGFTQEDAELVRRIYGSAHFGVDEWQHAAELAVRIEALLPPREEVADVAR